MIGGKIWKAGNSYVVTIPRDEMEARGLHVGQMVGIEPIPLELRPGRSTDARAACFRDGVNPGRGGPCIGGIDHARMFLQDPSRAR